MSLDEPLMTTGGRLADQRHVLLNVTVDVGIDDVEVPLEPLRDFKQPSTKIDITLRTYDRETGQVTALTLTAAMLTRPMGLDIPTPEDIEYLRDIGVLA